MTMRSVMSWFSQVRATHQSISILNFNPLRLHILTSRDTSSVLMNVTIGIGASIHIPNAYALDVPLGSTSFIILVSDIELHIAAKRGQRQTGHLEMLFAERDTYYSDAQQDTEQYMVEPRPQAPEYYPDDIQRDADASGRGITLPDLGAERPQTQNTDLECLHGKRDAHDSDSQSQAPGEVAYGSLEPSEDPPQQVSNNTHKQY